MGKNVVIHVGMGKALSSFLQSRVFPYISNCKNAREGQNPIKSASLTIINECFHNFDIEELRQKVNKYISQIDEESVLVSEEWFEGHVNADFRDKKSIAEALHTLFPNGKILIVVRRQDKWLESLYKQMISYGYSMSFRSFINYRKGRFLPWRSRAFPNIQVDQISILNLVNLYHSQFGAENVKVIPFELFLRDKEKFLNEIYEFFELEPYYPPRYKVINPSVSNGWIYFMRVVNRFLIRPYNSLGFIPSPEKPLETPPAKFCRCRRVKYRDQWKATHGQVVNEGFGRNFLRCRVFNKDYLLSKWWSTFEKFFSTLSLEKILLLVDKVVKVKVPILTEEMSREIMKVHAEDNRELSSKIGYDLKEYGYH
ncbi:hypothetical protein [Salidesulfovibrio onnuriiensis]|uniref:hypothetical protein n=1 Tax=Salidesulfovibrio onnuriiensis TaxID=2583823 RepID=UPI0011C6F3BF|nr:hypothetical protein [Salidesulfovibrio onnuriiensis]